MTVRNSASSGTPMSVTGTALRRRARSGKEKGQRLGPARAVKGTEEALLPGEVQEVEQRVLVETGAVGILHGDTGAGRLRIKPGETGRHRVEHPGTGPFLPDPHEMRLPARGRPHEHLHRVGPVGPRIDQPHRSKIAFADQKVFGAKRRPVRQVECKLTGAHGVWTSDREARSARLLLRG